MITSTDICSRISLPRLMIISRKSFLPYFCLHPRYPLLVFIYTGASMRSPRIASLRYRARSHRAPLSPRVPLARSPPSPLRRYRVIQVGRQAGRDTPCTYRGSIELGVEKGSDGGGGGRIVTFDSWCKSSDVIKSDCKMYQGPARYPLEYLTRYIRASPSSRCNARLLKVLSSRWAYNSPPGGFRTSRRNSSSSQRRIEP